MKQLVQSVGKKHVLRLSSVLVNDGLRWFRPESSDSNHSDRISGDGRVHIECSDKR